MAEFDPLIPETDPNYTDRSKGAKVYSPGDLISGVGDLFSAGVKAANTIISDMGKADVRDSVERIRDGELEQLGAPQIPAEIGGSIDRLKVAKTAKDTGQLGNAQYYLMLDYEARRLRSKYAGHKDVIDDQFQHLTGTTPANRAVDLLRQAASARSTQDDEKWHIHHAITTGGPLGEHLSKGLPPPPLADMIKLNAQYGQHLATQKNTAAQQNISEAARKANEHSNEMTVQKILVDDYEVRRRADGILNDSSYEKLTSIAKQARTELSGEGGVISSQTQKQLNDAVAQHVAEETQRFNKKLYEDIQENDKKEKYTWASQVTPEARTRLTEMFTKKLNADVRAFTDKDWGLLAANAADVDAKQKTAMNELLSDPNMGRLEAYRKVTGDTAFGIFAFREPFLSVLQESTRKWLIQGIGNDKKLDDEWTRARKALRDSGGSDVEISQTKKAFIDSMTTAMKDPNATPKMVESIARKLFSGDPLTSNWYANETPSNQEYLYKTLLNPRHTELIFATNNTTLIENYDKWAQQATYQRLEGLGKDANNAWYNPSKYMVGFHGLNEGNLTTLGSALHKNNKWTVSYDPKTNSFAGNVPNPNYNEDDKRAATTWGPDKGITDKLARELNTIIASTNPLHEKKGRDPVAEMQAALERSNLMVDPSGAVVLKPVPVQTNQFQSEQPKTSPVTTPFQTSVNKEPDKGTLKDSETRVDVNNPLGLRPEIKERLDKFRKGTKEYTDEQWQNMQRYGR